MRAVALALLLGVVAAVAVPARVAAQEVAVRKVDLAEPGAQAADAAPAPGARQIQSVFFWLFALITVGGAVAMVTRRNAVTAVMSLVGSFLGLAALYAMLYAHFVAVIQVLVYAGAIMVLFVFVVMILNKEEEEPWALRGVFGKALAGLALLYFVIRLIQVLVQVPAAVPERAEALPAAFGTTHGMADLLFSSYLFPFEAVSLVLLIAVVGALVLAHPGHPNVGEEESP